MSKRTVLPSQQANLDRGRPLGIATRKELAADRLRERADRLTAEATEIRARVARARETDAAQLASAEVADGAA